MLGSKIFAIASMVLGAVALPTDNSGNFTVTVHNKCTIKKSFAGFQIAMPQFSMSQLTKTLELAPQQNGSLSIPFNAKGVRISGDAEKGVGAQWGALSLVEFGYAEWNNLIGTAFDLSMMGGADKEHWLTVCPKIQNDVCKCKQNDPTKSALEKLAQVWTSQGQDKAGSPADTTCMKGKQDYIITWCG